MKQLTIIHDTVEETNVNLPWGDSVTTQGQAEFAGGEVITQAVEVV
ncbi:MAG: hypothetical protein LKI85_10985 [Enterobacter sp.]|jgi:hypothetical protein|nr:hypothetical protein [Enterobacter sp.]